MTLDSIRAKIEHAREIRRCLLSLQSPLLARALGDTISHAHHAWAAGRVSSPAYRSLDRWIEAYPTEAYAKRVSLFLKGCPPSMQ